MASSPMGDSVFEFGEESDFSPQITKPKLKPTKPKTTTTKITKSVGPKSKPAPKAKPVAPKKRARNDSDIENSDGAHDSLHDDSLLDDTPPKKVKKAAAVKKSSGNPLKEINNESFDFMDGSNVEIATPKGNENVSDKYKKLSHVEHILIRPDTYIGSVERSDQEMWVYNSETDAIEFRKVSYVPGLYKIFDEILVNAADNKQNDKNMDEIKVTVDRETGVISVQNNGKGIPIEMHAKEGIYIPELIFGHLLSSSNYNDQQAKITGGRNGYGAKLCNVFSKQFTIETVDSKQKQKYVQTWTDNMSKKGKAKITDNKNGKDYTKVTFSPDYSKFGMEGMDDDFEALVKRRIYDMAGTLKKVKVFLNGERIKIRGFDDYMKMYTKAIQAEQGVDSETAKDVIIVDNPHDRWEIGFAVSDGSFKQVSFVNSIATTAGGSHVKCVADQIVNKLVEELKKKNKKGVALKNHQIQNHIFLFVNCQIVNPAFTSQTKEQLTTKQSQFGSKFQVSDAFMRKILKTEVMTNIMNFAEKKADQLLAKSDGSKRARMNNAKLTDANKAGTKDGHQCTLILTEGDSASGLALAGRAVLDPDRIGVFPLRGKLLNVRDASVTQISNNAEIQNIKKFMGLQHKKEYTDTKSLRYGRLMIMTDQDHDGSHIKGLLINFLETQYPSLLKLPDFLSVFITPIVKCWKGDPKDPIKTQHFYTMPEFETFTKLPGYHLWEHKYFKGLGTSQIEDAEMYFRDLDRHLKQFSPIKTEESELIDLAFSKKRADARKIWLRDFVPGTYLDMAPKFISYDDFVNKELILFSMADNLRSIPSVLDGLKPSQRKVMYTTLKLNIKRDWKVVSLAGTVSSMTAYPYGENSLQQTIVSLAQDFVGSNNVNLLEPSGNFGSRRLGGNDAASPRYIYTRLSPFARKLFHSADDALLNHEMDDGNKIEPSHYVPILPVLLLNGADGIGTGWSTSIPNYNPEDIVENLKLRMAGDSKEVMQPMKPWFRGFKGEVEDLGNDRWKFNGKAQQTGASEIEVTELPVRYWTQDFKDKLEDIIKAEKTPSFIKDYAEYNTPTDIHFVIKIDEKKMAGIMSAGLEETFKLAKTMATSNLVAFDAQGRIHKYETVLDMMEEFYHVRLRFYEKRKQNLLDELQNKLDKLTNQSRFIKMIIDGKLTVSKKKKDVLVAELRKLNFKAFPKKIEAKKAGELEEIVDNANENPNDFDEDTNSGARDYDYLLGMAIWSLTEERVARLFNQIGDVESEIDKLIKKTPKDLWTTDLDDFINEWHLQLSENKKRVQKRRAAGRRGSSKLGLMAKGGKRRKKDDDSGDDDFTVGKKKTAVKGVLDRVKGKQASAFANYFAATEEVKVEPTISQAPASPGADMDDNNQIDFMDIDDEPEVVAVKKQSRPAVSKAKIPTSKPASKPKATVQVKDDSFDGDEMLDAIEKQAPSRQARATSKKKTNYAFSDSDESNGDDMLGDVSMMVKGIGSSDSNAAGTSRPLFSNTAGRPSSSQGIPRAISTTKKQPVPDLDSDGIDETDYKSLIPKDSPVKAAPKRAGEIKSLDFDDDEDSFDMPKAKSKMITKKASTTASTNTKNTTKKAPPVKAKASSETKKAATLSPAAKLYATKKAKAATATTTTSNKAAPRTKMEDSEEDEDLANDLLSSPIAIRPGRRTVVATKKAKYSFSDSDEDEDEEPEDSFVVDDDSE